MASEQAVGLQVNMGNVGANDVYVSALVIARIDAPADSGIRGKGKPVKRIVLLGAVLSLVFAASAHAAYSGKIQLFCSPNLSESAAVDPIAGFGISPFWESQTPAGSQSFSSTDTNALIQAAPTSCSVQNDDSLFWVPTPLTPAGTPASIKTMSYYIIEQEPNSVTTTPPNGLEVLGGNPGCDANNCEQGHFNCTTSTGGTWTGQTVPTVADCAAGVGYQEMVSSPGTCWDGASLGQGLGGAGAPSNITVNNSCTGENVPIIEVVLEVNNNGLGGYLSEDVNPTARPGESASFDFVYGWLNGALSKVVASCMGIPTVPQNELTCREHLDSDGITRLYYNNPVTNKADLTKLVTS